MKKILYLTSSLFGFLLILGACNDLPWSTSEITLTDVPSDFRITVTPEQITTNQISDNTIITPTSCISENHIKIFDTTIYEGIIVITQFYTYLGHGHYQEAYDLLSVSAKKHSPTFEDFNRMAKISFKSVQIVKILPLFLWSCDQKLPFTPEIYTATSFYIQIKAEGEGKMSGSVPSGEIQTLILTLIKEDADWKIDTFGTIPLAAK